jgi:putative ABC transport system substrate-binding protein
MLKKLCPPLILLVLFPICFSLAQEKKVKKIFRIGVVQFFSTPSFDQDQKGFEKALADAGFKEKVHVLYDRQNAEGNLSNTRAIVQKFLVEKFDLIHTISTPASQEAVKFIRDIPVVFSYVTDPVGAGLVSLKSRLETEWRTNITGVSHYYPVRQQFEICTQFIPKAKKWGTIYNASDSDSLAQIREMREASEKLRKELIEATISSSEETIQATEFLAGKVHALYILYDYTVLSALDHIVKVCNEKKIPLFTSEVESVQRGVIAAYGVNFFLVGYSAGKRAARILKGKRPGDIPWGRVSRFSLVVNERAARAQGVIIPPDLLQKSGKIIH